MKKILMCAAVLALATSCTDELENLSVQETASNGLTFKAEIGEPESRAELTYDEASKVWNMFWYAEEDQLAVVGKNVNGKGGAITEWDAANKVVYKASRTLGEGFFVAENTAEAFDFYKADNNVWMNPSFRYYWPATATLNKNMTVTLPSLKGQVQSDLNGSSTVKNAFMSGKLDNVALPGANPEKYSASDVLIGMKLTRKFPLALFSVKNYDSSLHGKLVEIKMTSEGHEETGEDGKETIAEYLDYGDAYWNLTDDALFVPQFGLGTTNKATSVSLKFGANGMGMVWEDDATAFMTFNTIDRSKNTTASKMKVEYVFENITFVDEFTSRTSYVAHQAYRMSGTTANPAFDLQASPYLVVKNAAARSAEETYALVINPSFTGNVSTIFTKVNGVDKVQDPFNEDLTYDVTSITRLIVYPNIEGTALNKLTALTDVEFKNQTSLYEDMLNASTITNFVANNVTTVDVEFNGENTPSYEELSLSKYLFNEGNEVNAIFFNDNTQKSLKTLNISSVKDMVYPFKNISLVFEGYKLLETVTLNAEGVNLSQRAFNNCTSLATVNGKVNFETFEAVYAFAQTKIATIDVVGSMIATSAFHKATNLAAVKFVKADLTTIGEYAFEGCTALKYFDLETVATLGEFAFNTTGLISNNKDTNILTVGATAIPRNTFEKTSVKLVRFTEATEIGNNILNNCASLSQVRFDKAFVANCKAANSTFSNAANVTLYVDKANQTGVDGYTLILPWPNGESVTSITFKGIYDNSYWTE